MSNKAEFEKTYVDNLHNLETFIYGYMKDMDVARSLAQDVFMILWDKRDTMEWERGVAPYIFHVAKNKCLTALRKKKSEMKYSDYARKTDCDLTINALEHSSASSLYSQEVRKIYKNALLQMSDQTRETYLLSKVELLKNREIAKKCNIAISTVEYRLSNAYKILRKCLKDYLPFVLWLLLLKA